MAGVAAPLQGLHRGDVLERPLGGQVEERAAVAHSDDDDLGRVASPLLDWRR